MPDQIRLIPLDAIDAEAMPRDRTAADPAAFDELVASIARSGLRMPVELFGLEAEDAAAPAYGLISGHRRLAAFRHLRDMRGNGDFAAIPALLRNPGDIAAALAAMVEENEIRRDLSPWERAAIAVTARDRGIFATIEQAVDALYPAAARQKRAKLRNIAFLVHEADGVLRDPEQLSERQLLRLHAAWTTGFGEVIETALTETTRRDAAGQWELIRPILAEAEAPPPAYTAPEIRPGRPRRLSRPRPGLTLRRERTPDGYAIHITGRDATSPFLDHIFEEIERLVGER
ncbi:MAG TPA: ParB/RepB/Spo0J family partition protein [Amaricoccus sp.]|uniref:ParB/RepB/Spo0J family partition protein n=1 Tax=Amaricoccus sp. TaxID=1872485 RepID=UPI002B8A3D48|nr:ParB/RepB/Spo0J family partition protein [Amaricoccus sp.]HMQ94315.1 ParB/RepB/Spo0J family partition protein [Amaricoccus sp.]HMR53979.1 ParB/RepB/Spo0J family partition protein [Amaricoccus sp.]HMR60945.1 ParB/RepB/Spo0J family partition protein [Amaricoccus sp.]HMU00975.1 ParB/RepB/Spo0J family partition protein [Amaricoccus sp.]